MTSFLHCVRKNIRFGYLLALVLVLALASFASVSVFADSTGSPSSPTPPPADATPYVVFTQTTVVNGVPANPLTPVGGFGSASNGSNPSQGGLLTTVTTSYVAPDGTTIYRSAPGTVSFVDSNGSLLTPLSTPLLTVPVAGGTLINDFTIQGQPLAGTNYVAGPQTDSNEDTFLESITVSCGASVTTVSAIMVNGQINVPATRGVTNVANCDMTYNFVPRSTGMGGAGNAFGGTLTVTPQVSSAPSGTATTRDYTLTFRSISSISWNVYFGLDGSCPLSSCTFPNGTTAVVGPNGTASVTLRVSTANNTSDGNYLVPVAVAPTAPPASSSEKIRAVASLQVGNGVGASNHAQFVSYQYNTGSGWANGLPATVTPGQVIPVRVTMQNDGSTTWTTNTNGAGASCSSNPRLNGYSLKPVGSATAWGVNRVPLPSQTTGQQNGLTSTDFSLTTNFTQTNTYPFYNPRSIGEIELFDQAGNLIPSSNFTLDTSRVTYAAPNPGRVIDGDPSSAYVDNLVVNDTGTVSFVLTSLSGPITISKVNVRNITGWGGATTPSNYVYFGKYTRSSATSPFGSEATWTTPAGDLTKSFGTIPGGTVTFNFNVTAPTDAGSYLFQWKMSEDCVEDFNNASAAATINVSGGGPSVDLRAHTPDVASDPTGANTLIVLKNQSLYLSWTTANNPAVCTASGAWSGSKTPSGGSENRTADTASAGSKTYTLNCVKNGATDSRNVTVLVIDPPLPCDLSRGTNRMNGCVYQWDPATPFPPASNPPSETDTHWLLHSSANPSPVRNGGSNSADLAGQSAQRNGLNGLFSHFMVVWKGRFNWPAGIYRFQTGSDDGHKLFLRRSTDSSPLQATPSSEWSQHVYNNPELVSSPYTITSGPIDLDFYSYQDIDWTAANVRYTRNLLPTVTLTAIPSSVAFNGRTSVRWTSSNADDCSVVPGGWTGQNGNRLTGPLSVTTTYTATCTNSTGSNSASATVTVGGAAAPTVTMTATPTTVPYNGASTVTWSSTNATDCVVTPSGWTGASGSNSTGPLVSTTTYTATCTGPGGSQIGSATVTVSGANFTLTVIKNSGGTVQSTDGLINCGATCSRSYTSGTTVTLTPTPISGRYKFAGWSGACSGTGACTVTIDASKTVTATFSPRPLIYQEF